MSSEFYSIEEAAKILDLVPSELTGERSPVSKFRDGGSWKFKKADVDNYKAEQIKMRSQNNQEAAESDFDLLNDGDDEAPTLLADQPSFDTLANSLPDEDEMVSKMPAKTPDDDDNDDFSLGDDDLMLAGDDLVLSDDSDVPISLEKKPSISLTKPSGSDVDLAVDADDLILDGGSSPQLNLAGDSGLSLLDDDDLQPVATGGSDDDLIEFEDILSLADDDDLVADSTSTIAIPVEEDFQLSPDSEVSGIDDSESASQVIALEGDNIFGGSSEGSSDFGPTIEPMPGPGGGFGTQPAFDAGAAPGEFVSSPVYTPTPTSKEAEYGPMSVVVLFMLAGVLALAGVMVFDLIIHIWSWGEPFVISSTLMDLFAGMAGLK